MNIQKLSKELKQYLIAEEAQFKKILEKAQELKKYYPDFIVKYPDHLSGDYKKPLICSIVKNQADIESISAPYIAYGVDGSEAQVSHHEGWPLSVISFSGIKIDYIKHKAEMFDDFFIPNLVKDNLPVAVQRSFFELDCALKIAESISQSFIMIDGSLIPWGIIRLEKETAKKYIQTWQIKLAELAQKLPVVGYISQSNASELAASIIAAYKLPAEEYEGVIDRYLLNDLNQKSTSPFFGLDFGEGCSGFNFSYINIGSEIIRLEWFGDRNIEAWILEAILDQIKLGERYPIVLSEAHDRAVLRGADREVIKTLTEEIRGKIRIGSGKGLSKKWSGW